MMDRPSSETLLAPFSGPFQKSHPQLGKKASHAQPDFRVSVMHLAMGPKESLVLLFSPQGSLPHSPTLSSQQTSRGAVTPVLPLPLMGAETYQEQQKEVLGVSYKVRSLGRCGPRSAFLSDILRFLFTSARM